MDTQRFLSCRTIPSKLSLWEKAEVKKQIDALVVLGKMKLSTLDYACKVILPMKKDGNHQFCGDYRPLNM